MKTSLVILSLFVALVLLTGCGLRIGGNDFHLIEPSNTLITEERTVSGFTGIDFSTFGRVIITQGDTESLTIRGSDNIVPLVKTTVQGDVLTIRMDEDVNVIGLNDDNILTFSITVRDLSHLTISGAGKITMDALSTMNLDVTMSGAGEFVLDQLAAETLDVTVSGVGGVEIAGEVAAATIEISGAGPVNCPDLKIQTATVTISGLGNATIWVTGQLIGEISGAGSISYYGNPQTDTTTSGLGQFQSMGNR